MLRNRIKPFSTIPTVPSTNQYILQGRRIYGSVQRLPVIPLEWELTGLSLSTPILYRLSEVPRPSPTGSVRFHNLLSPTVRLTEGAPFYPELLGALTRSRLTEREHAVQLTEGSPFSSWLLKATTRSRPIRHDSAY